jgi:hypothetical protein
MGRGSKVRNANIYEITETWEKNGETIQVKGLLGWDDPHMQFEQSMNHTNTRLSLVLNGWNEVKAPHPANEHKTES